MCRFSIRPLVPKLFTMHGNTHKSKKERVEPSNKKKANDDVVKKARESGKYQKEKMKTGIKEEIFESESNGENAFIYERNFNVKENEENDNDNDNDNEDKDDDEYHTFRFLFCVCVCVFFQMCFSFFFFFVFSFVRSMLQ